MKRTIKFSIDTETNKYIFQENKEKKLEIDIKDKILSGTDLYKSFFKDYQKGDSFEILDTTTEQDKITDKMCKAIYEKIVELFSTIEKDINSEIFSADNTNSQSIISSEEKNV